MQMPHVYNAQMISKPTEKIAHSATTYSVHDAHALASFRMLSQHQVIVFRSFRYTPLFELRFLD